MLSRLPNLAPFLGWSRPGFRCGRTARPGCSCQSPGRDPIALPLSSAPAPFPAAPTAAATAAAPGSTERGYTRDRTRRASTFHNGYIPRPIGGLRGEGLLRPRIETFKVAPREMLPAGARQSEASLGCFLKDPPGGEGALATATAPPPPPA